MKTKSRIKMIKFYQGVLLEGATLPSFTPDEFLSDAGLRKGRSAEISEHGVLVSGIEMNVLVPWNNVAYVQYVEGADPKQATKAKQ